MMVAVWIVFPAYFYVMTRTLRELSELPKQLRDFRLDDAQCFCCTHSHRHPTTGDELMCDRQLIYSILQHWTKEKQPLEPVLRTPNLHLIT